MRHIKVKIIKWIKLEEQNMRKHKKSFTYWVQFSVSVYYIEQCSVAVCLSLPRRLCSCSCRICTIRFARICLRWACSHWHCPCLRVAHSMSRHACRIAHAPGEQFWLSFFELSILQKWLYLRIIGILAVVKTMSLPGLRNNSFK